MASTHSPSQLQKCVLIVEDDPLTLKLFGAVIRSQDFTVLEAASGTEGLGLARTHHPDLIVLDIRLPDISGLRVAELLKGAADTRAIPILATSAHALANAQQALHEVGCDGFMAKPIRIDDFLALALSLMRCAPAGTLEGLRAPPEARQISDKRDDQRSVPSS